MENIYKTGELSQMLGVTRDTLRYYEEKGIIKPKQGEENNYRQYDMLDIYALLVIDFYKKRGLELNEVKKLQAGSEIDELRSLLEKKETELLEVIQNQKKILQKIRETSKFCSTLEKHLGQYSIKKMPSFEIIGEISDFAAFHEYDKVFMGMNRDEEDILSKMIRQVTFDETGVQDIRVFIADKVKKSQKIKNRSYLEFPRCAYTIVEDGRYNNAEDHIMENISESSLRWIYKKGFKPVGVAYANTRLIIYQDKKERVFIEIFIPIQ